MDTSIPSGGCLVHDFDHELLLWRIFNDLEAWGERAVLTKSGHRWHQHSAAMHPVVDTMAFADTVTWYLLYLRFSVGLKP